MRKIFTLISFGLLLTAMSCSREELKLAGGIGRLNVDVAVDGQTRAVSEDELRNSAQVKVYMADFSGLVRSYVYSKMPSTMYLVEGDYRVDVHAGECVKENPDSASWDSKSYKGSSPFTIVHGQSQTVRVEAKLNNAVTNITFDPTVAENFKPGYTFTLSLDKSENVELVYDASKAGSEGYFIIAGLFEPSLNWTFTGTLAKDGSAFTKSGKISNVEPGKLYKMNIKYTVTDGDLTFTLMVDYGTENVDDTLIFEPVSTGLAESSPFEIWAKRATVHADIDPGESEGKTVQFTYSSNGSNWSTVEGKNDSEGAWSAELTGLNPSTEYTYRLLIDGVQVGDEMKFTTEAAPAIPNGSFEYVSKVADPDNDYYKFYDPNCGVEEGKTMFWGSGNGEGPEGSVGSASMNTIITDVDFNDYKHGSKSVVAQSKNAAGIGMLAAGNLFSGQFKSLVGTKGGMVNFGRPWTSRPSKLKVWCKYTTGKMDLIKNQPPDMTLSSSMYDRAQIKVAIGTWSYKDNNQNGVRYGGTPDSPICVNTTEPSTFVDFYTDPRTIANGDVIIYNDGYTVNKGAKVSATTSGWILYEIPLIYRNLNATPTHIVVSFASSQYGDYFSGSSSSKLWIDQVELVYE